jgi:hypothetical protein
MLIEARRLWKSPAFKIASIWNCNSQNHVSQELLVVSYHLCLCIPNGLFLSGFTTEMFMPISWLHVCCICHIPLNLIIPMKITDYERPHFAVFWMLLSCISDTLYPPVAGINQGKNSVQMCVLYSITVKHLMKMILQWGRLVTACDRSLRLDGESWMAVIQRPS